MYYLLQFFLIRISNRWIEFIQDLKWIHVITLLESPFVCLVSLFCFVFFLEKKEKENIYENCLNNCLVTKRLLFLGVSFLKNNIHYYNLHILKEIKKKQKRKTKKNHYHIQQLFWLNFNMCLYCHMKRWLNDKWCNHTW